MGVQVSSTKKTRVYHSSARDRARRSGQTVFRISEPVDRQGIVDHIETVFKDASRHGATASRVRSALAEHVPVLGRVSAAADDDQSE